MTRIHPFGNNLCATKIGTFNGYPSRLLTIFFRDDNISAFKLIYRDQYHKQFIGHFIRQLGQPSNVEAALAESPSAANVLEWDLNEGVLLMSKELGKNDEPSVLWLAARPDTPELIEPSDGQAGAKITLTRNPLPFSPSPSTILAPCRSAIRFTIDSPSPLPFVPLACSPTPR